MHLKNTKKMDAKKLMVSFVAIAMAVFLVATVSAAKDITDNLEIRVNDELATSALSVVAGETITVKAVFNSLADASDVTVKVEIEGDRADASVQSSSFDVEDGLRYSKTLEIEVPYELKDEVSDDVSLIVTIKKGSTFKTSEEFTLRVQRPSYNADILSVVTSNTVNAGQDFPVDIVLRNIGYNDLEDVYVSAKLSALNGVERTVYFGDLVSLEDDDDDDEDTTVSGRITLEVPYDVEPGIYVLAVEVSNDDLETSMSKQVIVKNDFPNTVVKAGNDLLIINPTDSLKVFRVVFPETEQFVTVPAGSTKAVTVNPNAEEYTVSVLSMSGETINSFTFDSVEDTSATSPIVVLTVILAIIFLVLLVVLIVLIGKKPERTEEFGESYY